MKDWIKIGAKCKWNDPGINEYEPKDRAMMLDRVFDIVSINGDIIGIENDVSYAEVFESEITPVKFEKVLIFGSLAVEEYEDNPNISRRKLMDLGDVVRVSFSTQEELNAYIKGVNDAIDWNDVTESFNPKHKRG